jgi:hypothetical protein
MKVSELIEELQKKYEPNTELIVAYWDKKCFKALDTEERLLTDKEWNVTAQNFVMQYHDQMLGAEIRAELEGVMKHENIVNEMFIKQYMEDYYEGTTDEQLWDKE